MKTSIKFTLHHFVGGIWFFTKIFGKINHHPLIAIIFLFIGFSILSFCWMKMRHKQNAFLKNLMHLLEGIALITTAYFLARRKTLVAQFYIDYTTDAVINQWGKESWSLDFAEGQ